MYLWVKQQIVQFIADSAAREKHYEQHELISESHTAVSEYS